MSTDSLYAPDLHITTREKLFYTLVMFPYPSGYGLHVGHASNYVINDVLARYKRLQGYTVFNPFGYDSFGLPTENYAMKLGKPAYQVTEENITYFNSQLAALDLSFDTQRTVTTSSPEYYKRTQRIFQQLYKAGLVYRDTLRVNRCPSCQTVLANDQVVDGTCERCKSEIIQKKHLQRFIKITAYAEKLLKDLDLIEWPEETKIGQRNWIGRSEGAEIDFKIGEKIITVFTTRPDTIYGVTALVLAPENLLLDGLLTDEFKPAVEEYRESTLAKTAVQRQKDLKEKTGVFSGLFAIHPLTDEKIPVWYADYVLPDYGTGAVMMVPAHDERDFEFAKKFGIECKVVIASKEAPFQSVTNEEYNSKLAAHWEIVPEYNCFLPIDVCFTGLGFLFNSQQFDGLDSQEAKKAITDHLESIGKGRKKISYKLRDRSVSRQRYRGSPIPVYYDENDAPQLIPEQELPVVLPLDLENYKPTGKSPLADHPTFPIYEKDGKTYRRECDTLDTFMCSSFYFLRYPDANNPEMLGDPTLLNKCFPIDFYIGGKEHTVGHLLYARFIHKFLYDQGYLSCPEPFQKLVHQGMVLGADGRKMSKRRGNVIDPVEVIEKYGSDALRVYLMFMGPVEQEKVWNDNALAGVAKFLGRILKLQNMQKDSENKEKNMIVERALHKAIKGITDDMEAMKYNTSVSKLMILLNSIEEQKTITNEQLSSCVILLFPFAPKICRQIWTEIGNTGSVEEQSRPIHDPALVIDEMISLPVQINGKMRGNISISPDLDETAVLDIVQQDEHLKKYLTDVTIKKVIYVSGRILNIVI